MAEQSIFNMATMTYTRILWCCCLFGLLQTITASSIEAQFMSFCNQTINMSSPLSIIFTPTALSSSSSCCSITLIKPSLANLSEKMIINIINFSQIIPSLQIFNQQKQPIHFLNYSLFNRALIKTDMIDLPLTLSLCQFNVQTFEILITNITKGPCLSNQYRCSINSREQWCIDEMFRCDGYHSCPQGIDELNCSKSMPRTLPKMKRAIHGGIVTTIIVFGLLLIIGSVSIAVAFVYVRRKRQRRRQFTYSLESTSDDWEPSGTGYHLFDNWTNNRRSTTNNIDNVIIDANEHMPITNR